MNILKASSQQLKQLIPLFYSFRLFYNQKSNLKVICNKQE